jgi:hypothetical protein
MESVSDAAYDFLSEDRSSPLYGINQNRNLSQRASSILSSRRPKFFSVDLNLVKSFILIAAASESYLG